jgi:methionine-rich copper-binding protein CopC
VTMTMQVYLGEVPDPPEPLVLLSSVPADDATGVSASANLSLTFNRDIALGTGNITILTSDDDSTVEAFNVASSVLLSVVGPTVTINPTSNLPAEGLYITVADTAIDDLEGVSFAGISDKTTLNFTVAASDVTAPTLQTLSPADGATGVAVGANFVLTYNEAIQWQSTVDVEIRLTADDTLVAAYDETDIGTVLTISGAVATINHASDLSYSTGYYILVDGIEDLAGNNATAISASTTWNFTTSAELTSTVDGGESFADSGTRNIDGMNLGVRWTFSSETRVMEYGFVNDGDATTDGTAFGGEISDGAKTAVRWWMEQLGKITGITFFEGAMNSETANINVCLHNASGSFSDFPPNGGGTLASVFISSTANSQIDPGEFGWRTIGHEIGHAMGMKHPHQTTGGNPTIETSVDCQSASIMSYRNIIGGSTTSYVFITDWPQSYMKLDVDALRYAYGTGDAPVDPVFTWDETTGQAFINGVAVRPAPASNRVFECLYWDGECDLTNFGSPDASDLTEIITDSGQLGQLQGDPVYADANVFTATGTDLTAET